MFITCAYILENIILLVYVSRYLDDEMSGFPKQIKAMTMWRSGAYPAVHCNHTDKGPRNSVIVFISIRVN